MTAEEFVQLGRQAAARDRVDRLRCATRRTPARPTSGARSRRCSPAGRCSCTSTRAAPRSACRRGSAPIRASCSASATTCRRRSRTWSSTTRRCPHADVRGPAVPLRAAVDGGVRGDGRGRAARHRVAGGRPRGRADGRRARHRPARRAALVKEEPATAAARRAPQARRISWRAGRRTGRRMPRRTERRTGRRMSPGPRHHMRASGSPGPGCGGRRLLPPPRRRRDPGSVVHVRRLGDAGRGQRRRSGRTSATRASIGRERLRGESACCASAATAPRSCSRAPTSGRAIRI